MKRVLLDSNIVLDFALSRTPFFADANRIIEQIIDNKFVAYVSASSVTDIFYVLNRNKFDAFNFLKDFLKIVDILKVDKEVIMCSLYLGWEDFEDAVQAEVALENDVDIIITRNTKDFTELKAVKVLTPSEFLVYV